MMAENLTWSMRWSIKPAWLMPGFPQPTTPREYFYTGRHWLRIGRPDNHWVFKTMLYNRFEHIFLAGVRLQRDLTNANQTA